MVIEDTFLWPPLAFPWFPLLGKNIEITDCASVSGVMKISKLHYDRFKVSTLKKGEILGDIICSRYMTSYAHNTDGTLSVGI